MRVYNRDRAKEALHSYPKRDASGLAIWLKNAAARGWKWIKIYYQRNLFISLLMKYLQFIKKNQISRQNSRRGLDDAGKRGGVRGRFASCSYNGADKVGCLLQELREVQARVPKPNTVCCVNITRRVGTRALPSILFVRNASRGEGGRMRVSHSCSELRSLELAFLGMQG